MAELLEEWAALVDGGDVCSVLLGGLILAFVAEKAVHGRPDARGWGLRLGVLAFMAWYVRDVSRHGFRDAEQLVTTGIRALLVLLYFTSVSWLLLAAGNCVSGQVLGSMSGQFRAVVRRACHRAGQLLTRVRRRFTMSRVEPRPVSPSPADREQTAREAAERQHAIAARRCARENVQYETELLYDRHRKELAESLPPERFQEYFSKYLTDDLDPEAYSVRAEQLKDMIRERAGARKRTAQPEFETLEDVIEHFRAKKQRLRLLDLDDDTLETLETTLDDLQDREVRKLLM
ncbi:MAG: hypothetical protein R3C59_09805 [Planctomycetaceae bacterium]